jgi:hypothetical protein
MCVHEGVGACASTVEGLMVAELGESGADLDLKCLGLDSSDIKDLDWNKSTQNDFP